MNNWKISKYSARKYLYVPKEKRKKWVSKNKWGISVGYGETVKALGVYFAEERKVIIARDVVFKPQMCMSPNDGVHEANEENDEMCHEIKKKSELENFPRSDEILQQIEKNSELEDFPRNDEMLQQIQNQMDQPHRLRNRNLIKRPNDLVNLIQDFLA
ncbi:hypothetical protein JTB14_036192 [Gonioctena quinquepunctata]|nr:hypothetical protein JTB14_036192 [Gonioctena quinquepunctata]